MRHQGTAIVCAGLMLAGISQPLSAQDTALSLVTDQLDWPTYVTHAPGDDDRLFVIERAGRVRIIANGQLLSEPFLDISEQVEAIGETGLLGIAFHPAYADNGRFFLYYGAPGTPRTTRIAEYSVSSDPNMADADSGLIVLEFPSSGVHAGGWIGFGHDGYLYIVTGESGNPANSQNNNELRGKVLRIDINAPQPGPPYLIPPDNPFIDNGAPEVFAKGLRNPYRAGFDRVTGDLWIGDVGSFAPQRREEVNFIPAGSPGGMNFGWPMAEGSNCNHSCDALTVPVYEYAGGGCAIVGGTVYRGCAIPELEGAYIFTDHCGGSIRSLRFENGQPIIQTHGAVGFALGIGADSQGELYVSTTENIFKLVPATPIEPDPCEPDISPGDLNGDGQVGVPDLLLLLNAWGQCAPPCEGDLNGDDTVGVPDLLLLLENWG